MTTNVKPKNKNEFNRDCWATPQWLFNWLDSIYDFDIDLCASKENTKVPTRYFSEEDDSLAQQWGNHGYTGFCNPTYSNIKPWVKKAIEEVRKGFTTAMLIPAPNGESYYQEVFDSASAITFISGRVAFYNPLLKKYVSGNTRGSCVVEFCPRYANKNIILNSVNRSSLIEAFK